jgi:hypothetical protein
MVEALDERIRNNREISITNVLFFPTSTIQGLKNIKSNKSLSHKYGMIYNQCVVLLVSYFTSSVKEFFRATYKLMANGDSELFRGVHTELKLTVEELSENRFNLADIIGDLVVKKNGISFQDMKSIVREFEHNFGICICKDEHLDNIIVLQAARHAIVHSMSVADDKFINQIRSTKQRSLKSQINLNDEILFTVEEINIAIQSMKLFFTDLNNSILKRLNNLS